MKSHTKNQATTNATGTKHEGVGNQEQGGYGAMLHMIEEECYGPNSPFDAKTKVFYYIRHQTIRDWKYVMAISSRDIMAATGIENRRQLSRVLEQLEEDTMIISYKSKTGKVWNPTQYALHPKRFGLDTLWRGKGSRIEKANRDTTHVVHGDGKIIPITRKKVVPTGRQEGGVCEATRGGVCEAPPTELKFSELMEEIDSKNPFKEPKSKEPSSEREKFHAPRDRKLQARWLSQTDGNISYDSWLERQA